MKRYVPQQGKRDSKQPGKVNWRCRDSRIVCISDMDDAHIISALQILEVMGRDYLNDQMSSVTAYWTRCQGEEASRYLESCMNEFVEGTMDLSFYLYEKDVRYWAMVEVLRMRGIDYFELQTLQIANEVCSPKPLPVSPVPALAPSPLVPSHEDSPAYIAAYRRKYVSRRDDDD